MSCRVDPHAELTMAQTVHSGCRCLQEDAAAPCNHDTDRRQCLKMLAERGCSSSMHSLLQICHRKGLHDCPCSLCLNLDLRTKHHFLAGLCCWLVPSLNHADPWNLEFAGALYFLVSDLDKSIQGLCHLRLLLLARSRECIGNCSFRHSQLSLPPFIAFIAFF